MKTETSFEVTRERVDYYRAKYGCGEQAAIGQAVSDKYGEAAGVAYVIRPFEVSVLQ